MIYLNQAATSYPKPQCVLDAHAVALRDLPGFQFRSATNLSNQDVEGCCQKAMGQILGVQDSHRIFFTSGATHSANAVLAGLLASKKRVVTTATEHNAILRPLYNMERFKDSKIDIVPCDKNGYVDPKKLESYLSDDVGLLIVNHCSNVTGMIQEMEQIGALAHEQGIIFAADVSQSAGCIPIKGDEWHADILIFTGHKSLLGVQGIGGYYIREGMKLIPFMFGGTGKDSAKLHYEMAEYEYIVGTQNGPGTTALTAGANYVLATGIEAISNYERTLISQLYQGLKSLPHVTVYGDEKTNKGPVASFNVKGLDPSDVAYILQNSEGIIVRAGLHCAPLIHEYIESGIKGTIRASVSTFNTTADIQALIKALAKLQGV